MDILLDGCSLLSETYTVQLLTTICTDYNLPLKDVLSKYVNQHTINRHDIVLKLSNNFTEIIPRESLHEYSDIGLNWGNNGIGDRWANKKYNYSVVFGNGKYTTYSENEDDILSSIILQEFIGKSSSTTGIQGIFVHSERTNITTRPIRTNIKKDIQNLSCVVCGSNSCIVCDHKNDLYNDTRVLNIHTQTNDDFQPLCNHCNLQKRQVCKKEKMTGILYSAKNIPQYSVYEFEFPWEKKAYDPTDIYTKTNTYWYDPKEFNRLLYLYQTITLPILTELKAKTK